MFVSEIMATPIKNLLHVLFILLMITLELACGPNSCKECKKSETSAADGSEARPDSARSPAGDTLTYRESFLSDSSRKFFSSPLLTNQKIYLMPEHVSTVQRLALTYSPEEVFLEILRRTERVKGDSIPPAFRRYYSPEETERIQRKNVRLRTLSNKDALSLYEITALYEGKRVIRGEDNREEAVYNTASLSNPSRKDLENARCVAAVISSGSLVPAQGGRGYVLENWMSLGNQHSLCNSERFIAQPAVAACSAFAINDSTIITAGHCIDSRSLPNYYFVFDFIIGQDGQPKLYFPEACVYKGISLIRRYDPAGNQDLCIIRVNKRIDPRRIPRISLNSAANLNSTYYVIGCPGGIPLKVAGRARITNNSHPAWFLVSSDTYAGNSGSPVFNYQTNEIEGYITEGATDFEVNRRDFTCQISVVCPFDECIGSQGEKVIRSSQFVNLIRNR